MKKSSLLTLFIICLIQICLGFMFGTEKTNYHIDEIFTFGLANNTSGITMTLPEGELLDRSMLNQYVTVDSSHRFDYSNVWANQTTDVHPPFYYTLIHTISSFFPDKFVIMGGIGLNILCSVIITILIFFITIELVQNEILSLSLSAVWAVSLANMTFIVFMRMYMMLALFIIAITLLHIRYISQKLTFQFYLGVVLLSIAGTLTQYYFLIYLFFLCFIFSISLLINKYFKHALYYLLSLGIAGIGAIFIFPGMLHHIFSGYRGKESFSNIMKTSNTLVRIKGYYKIINKELFNQLLPVLLIILAIIFFIFLFTNRNMLNWKHIVFSKYNLLLFPSLFYFIVVSKISVSITDRYMMPIFPVLLIIVISALTYLSSRVISKNYIILAEACFFVFISALGLVQNRNITYLYKETAPLVQFAKENKDSDVLVVYDSPWQLNYVYEELAQYEHIRVMSQFDLFKFKDIIDSYNDSIVYVVSFSYNSTMDDLMSMNHSWESYTLENETHDFFCLKLKSNHLSNETSIKP
ncbi:MAG: hypothetical protein ACERKZ_21240 [Lachnotalea sp.]